MACTQTLSNITLPCGEGSRGGLTTKIYMWNRGDATVTVDDTTKTITDITFKTGVIPNFVEFRKNSSSVQSEFTNDEANGNQYWTNTLNLVIGKQSSAKRIAVEAMCKAGMACIVEDANHYVTLLGYDEDVTCTAATVQTGIQASDANNYSLTLSDTSNELPYPLDADCYEAVKALLEPEPEPEEDPEN